MENAYKPLNIIRVTAMTGVVVDILVYQIKYEC